MEDGKIFLPFRVYEEKFAKNNYTKAKFETPSPKINFLEKKIDSWVTILWIFGKVFNHNKELYFPLH